MPSAARKIAPPQIEAPNAQTPPDGLFKASQEAAPEKLMVARPFMPVAAAITPYLGRIDGSGWYSDFGPLLMVGSTSGRRACVQPLRRSGHSHHRSRRSSSCNRACCC